jgi:hypothetical protein
MSLVTPLRPPVENNINPWLLDGLLPRNQVVLLDGYASVGKTALLALLTERITDQNKKRSILYLSSDRQTESRDLFLHRQRANFGQLHAVSFDLTARPLQSRQVYVDLITCIGEALVDKRPHCMIIDGMEEILADALVADAKMSRQFWNALHELARRCECTIIVTRNQGFHESRAYGHFTRIGSDLCSFALAMHYHPKSPAERVVTIIRHKLGPIGKQFHLKFTNDKAELLAKQSSENVRPAKSPAHDIPVKPTRQPKAEPTPTIEPKTTTIQTTTTPTNPNYENRAHEAMPVQPIAPPGAIELKPNIANAA